MDIETINEKDLNTRDLAKRIFAVEISFALRKQVEVATIAILLKSIVTVGKGKQEINWTGYVGIRDKLDPKRA